MNDFEFRIHMRMLDIIERGMLKKAPTEVAAMQEPIPVAKKVPDHLFVDKRVDEDLLAAMDGILSTDIES